MNGFYTKVNRKLTINHTANERQSYGKWTAIIRQSKHSGGFRHLDHKPESSRFRAGL